MIWRLSELGVLVGRRADISYSEKLVSTESRLHVVNSTELVSIVRSRNMFAFSSDERAFNIESYFRTESPIESDYIMDMSKASLEDVGLSLRRFGFVDYIVFVFMLLICAVIGVYYGFCAGKVTAAEYLMGGRNMQTFPVAMSLIARTDRLDTVTCTHTLLSADVHIRTDHVRYTLRYLHCFSAISDTEWNTIFIEMFKRENSMVAIYPRKKAFESILSDNAGEMSSGSNTESYPAFARIGLRENPGKNLNQVTCPDRDSNPVHLVSQPDALTVTPQLLQALKPEDKVLRRNFCISIQTLIENGDEFIRSVLFSEEATFHLSGKYLERRFDKNVRLFGSFLFTVTIKAMIARIGKVAHPRNVDGFAERRCVRYDVVNAVT
ncbi:hypothetical protein ANN_13653 [Periplaneta americana]|uniref:Uncharacterized protein n=1 Tax=Periplaneta americana TaxID=6978 RepID=A0ABQ8TK01_PERAM|nr:hypothetical protein ANN_13653 [Periplaneta americana]